MNKLILDNSNLAESYSGITTPLTFSFAKEVYAGVYENFCLMMGMGRRMISKNQDNLGSMVEFVGYRMYYNLPNWYLMISFLPGYRYNRRFFEKMLGVNKELPYEKGAVDGFIRMFVARGRLLYQIGKIGASFMIMGLLIGRFLKKFDHTMKELKTIDLDKLSESKLLAHYEEVKYRLVREWKVPIANDFAVMVSTGVADKLCEKWTGMDFYLDFEKLRMPISSLDPGKKLLSLAKIIADDSEARKIVIEKDNITALDFLLYHLESTVSPEFRQYIEEAGGRFPSELKLETETLKEKPEFLVGLIRQLILSGTSDNPRPRQQSVPSLNKISVVKRFILQRILRWADNSINRREETRFRRTIIFAHARSTFLRIGFLLAARGIINNQRDIFFLFINEVRATINSSVPVDLKPIIAKRKNEYKTWEKIQMPRRIETDKTIAEIEERALADIPSEKEKSASDHHMHMIVGTVASNPGTANSITGTALVMREFESGKDFRDKILVARHTDPGWTIVFPLVKAIIVERGGMLSHAAIVAREMKKPCIIGAENATMVIRDGSTITINFNDGTIKTK